MTTGVPEVLPQQAAPDIEARSPVELFWRRLRRDRLALASLGFIVLLVAAAALAPAIVDVAGARPPNETGKRFLDPGFGTPTGPSATNRFGVDTLGRDVFSRVLYGARASLLVALVATALAVAIGLLVGMLAGYFGGWVDTVLSRLVDVLLAFPILLLALGVAAACSLGEGCLNGLVQPGLGVVIFVIAFVNWTVIARIVRGQVLSLREREFVEASRSLGASHARILTREILPNLAAPLIVYTTLLIPQNILFEAALSFLGVGVQPPDASWGKMIADASEVFDSAWWFMLFPGVALLLTVLAFNILGDGMRDALGARSART
ncbi:MAG: peptide/nickel transport system permease protein [Thermoleophilaceae bacterium]|nr:peptide/nickel transport system permease protein [Thermoleophilaceae bacterium]